MKLLNLKTVTFAATLILSSGFAAHAVEKSVIGDPSKGTPIATVRDGNNKVRITTKGIAVEEGDEETATNGAGPTVQLGTANPNETTTGEPGENGQLKIGFSSGGDRESKGEAVLVPIAFFLFLVAVILGSRYISSRNEQRRIDLLKLMVEKGQPIPENVMKQILAGKDAPENDTAPGGFKQVRNAYGFTIAGVALLGYAAITNQWSVPIAVPGLVFLCLGIGGIAGLYNAKRSEKISG